MLGLDVSLLCLLEIDNVPNGIEVLVDKVSNELNSTLYAEQLTSGLTFLYCR